MTYTFDNTMKGCASVAAFRLLWVGIGVSMLFLGNVAALPGDMGAVAGDRLDGRVAVSRLGDRLGGTRLSAERPAEDERKTVAVRKRTIKTADQVLAGQRVRMSEQRMRKTRRVAAMR